MNVIGIHDGRTATACLLQHAEVVALVSEERFTRKKGQGGIPIRSCEWLLQMKGLKGKDIDAVSVGTIVPPLSDMSEDLKFPRNVFTLGVQFLPAELIGGAWLVKPYKRMMATRRNISGFRHLLSQLDIPCDRLRFTEHHQNHAITALLGPQAKSNEPLLVITLDGAGDGLSGTVSIGRGHRLTRLAGLSAYHSIGELYARTTQYLGLKPLEDEYKVMGLAPYPSPEDREKAYRVFSKYLRLSTDHLEIQNTSKAWGPGLLRRLRQDLTGLRFDAVAAGVQQVLEEVVLGFVQGWIRKTGIRRLGVAGGVFMNVKLNMLLNELPEVEAFYVAPSCGDESIAIGAALSGYLDLCEKRGCRPEIRSLGPLYLGPEYHDDSINSALQPWASELEWTRESDIERRTVELLKEGKIVGRVAGRMEWGERALGNRSILADPRNLQVVRRINAAIKHRDFWMPFAPAILWDRRQDYLISSKEIEASYMVLAYHTTSLGHRDLMAALHQSDLTCRPQVVQAEWNPRFYQLLKYWEHQTGCGALLNTSFNLHGEPIVCSPEDAIHTLLRSKLDCLTLGNYLVWPKTDRTRPMALCQESDAEP